MIGHPAISLVLFFAVLSVAAEMIRHARNYSESSDLPDETEPVVTSGAQFMRDCIITHTDFDGLTSGALMLRHLGKEAGIMFSSPRNVHRSIEKAAAGLTSGDCVYVLDLAMAPEREPEFVDIFRNLRERNIQIYWIDHHQWPAGLQDRMTTFINKLVIDTTVHTAAEIVRRLLPPEDSVADKMIRFIRNASFPADQKWDRTWRYLLSELTVRKDADMTEKVIRAWAMDEPLTATESYLARSGMKREAVTREIARDRHRSEQTARDRKFLVIDVRPRRVEVDDQGKKYYVFFGAVPLITVGMEACREHKADFCLILWSDFRFSLYRGIDRELSFKHIFPSVKREGSTFRIAGHYYAASIFVKTSRISQLKAVFRMRPPPELETFVDILKENF